LSAFGSVATNAAAAVPTVSIVKALKNMPTAAFIMANLRRFALSPSVPTIVDLNLLVREADVC